MDKVRGRERAAFGFCPRAKEANRRRRHRRILTSAKFPLSASARVYIVAGVEGFGTKGTGGSVRL